MGTRKKQTLLVVSFIIAIVLYLSYKYLDYSKKVDYLEDLYHHGGVGIMGGIEYMLSFNFELKAELPDKEAIDDYLQDLDSPLFNDKNYSLKVDYKTNRIVLYSFGPSKKDDKLKNKIDVRSYSNYDGDFKQNFSFLNYLWKGDYDIMFINGSLRYECNTRSIYKSIYYTKTDSIFFKDEKSTLRLDSILKSINLSSGFKKDFSNSIVYLYDGEKLRNMCPEKQFKIDRERENILLELIKKKFSDYENIKFSVAPKE